MPTTIEMKSLGRAKKMRSGIGALLCRVCLALLMSVVLPVKTLRPGVRQ